MRKLLGFAAGLILLGAGSGQAAEDVMIVFDGSNSMWGQIDGMAKIEIARQAMDSLIGEWAEGANVGLMAYGHRRKGDCGDIESILPPGPFDRDAFMARIGGITPRGKTPLTAAVEEAARVLAHRDNPATVILITDGIETCRRDPCALADELKRSGIDFTAHVVGFDLREEDHAAVACLAEQTGGRYLAADNADELNRALSEVGAAVAEAPEPEPVPEPQPEAELTAPETVVVGSSFPVAWDAPDQAERDLVTIVPLGAEDGALGNYIRAKDASEGTLKAPASAGLYEVRYVVDEDRSTAGSTEIEVVEAEVSVSAPERATTGAEFPVSWSRTIHPRDLVTIVPMGAAEDERGDYLRAKERTEGRLKAPAEAGLYEVRYVLNEGRRVLASSDIEVVEAEVSVSAPERATTGAEFPVSWSRTIHPRDLVTIVPMGAAEDETGDYLRAKERTEGRLKAPAEAGLYEVRYVLNEGRQVLASSDIEILEADIELSGPETVRAEAEIPVSWLGTAPSPRDLVTIVPIGAGEGEIGAYSRVRDRSEIELTAPENAGLYEVRYVLDEGRRTLARHTVEVVPATAPLHEGGALEVPETGAPGESVVISWSAEAGGNDQRIALAGADQPDFSWIEVRPAEGEEPLSFTLPDAPGYYEFRLLDVTDRKVLSRAIIEVR